METIVLKIEKSSAFFMRWFDYQMDTLLGDNSLFTNRWPGDQWKPSMEFPGRKGGTYMFGLDCGSYWTYRKSKPDYDVGRDFDKHFPLEVRPMAFYEFDPEIVFHHSPRPGPFPKAGLAGSFYPEVPDDYKSPSKETAPNAVVIELERLEFQMKVTVYYGIVEKEPLSWLLRAFATEYKETRTQIAATGILQELKSHVSPTEWAAWAKLEWDKIIVTPELKRQLPDLFEKAIDGWGQLGLRKPERKSTLDRWKNEYSLISRLGDEYRFDDEVSPKWADYIEYIKSETEKELTERHLRDVKKAGDKGLLT